MFAAARLKRGYLLAAGLAASATLAHAVCVAGVIVLVIQAPQIVAYAQDLGVSAWQYAEGICGK